MTDKDRMDVVDDCYKEMKRVEEPDGILHQQIRISACHICVPKRKLIHSVWWLSMATVLKNTGDAYVVRY